ncbi:unnamed protein product [Hapterophycus canaliculatus]
MSFFSNGFATMVNNRRNKVAKSNGERKNTNHSILSCRLGEKVSDGNDKKNGRWDMLTDAYGRLYWQHSVTGEWSFVYGSSALVSPIAAVHAAPMVYTGGTVFAPSPAPVAMVNPSKENKGEEQKKATGKGWWEAMYNEEGVRYWQHTVTKKITYKDPYF